MMQILVFCPKREPYMCFFLPISQLNTYLLFRKTKPWCLYLPGKSGRAHLSVVTRAIYVCYCTNLEVDRLLKYLTVVRCCFSEKKTVTCKLLQSTQARDFVPVALEESQGNPSRLWVHDGHALPLVPCLLCLLFHLWLLLGQLLRYFHCFHGFLKGNRAFCLI